MLKKYRLIYWMVLAGVLVFVLLLELLPDTVDGVLKDSTMAAFCLQYAAVAITLGMVYAALRLIKKNPILRIGMLEGPMIFDIICYHLFLAPSFGYLFIICLLAYVFVYPHDNSNS